MAVEAPPRIPVNNLANQLTMARLVLGVVLFVLIEWRLWLGCLIVFALAAVTDWLDGYYARKYNLVSALGRMLDPLVDKIVVCGAFILLLTIAPRDWPDGYLRGTLHFPDSRDNPLAGWMVVLIVGREFLVTGVRSHMEHEGIPFGADMWGKLKMVLQCAVLLVIFLMFAVDSHFTRPWTMETYSQHMDWMYWLVLVRYYLLWPMLFVTAGSGLNYCWKAARGLKASS